MSLAAPFALASLLAIGLLIGLYWLQRRRPSMPVTAIWLWQRVALAPAGGRRVETPRLPWWLLLEMLILGALALAAANPLLESVATSRRMLILDDSYSMRADGTWAAAQAALAEELESAPEDLSVLIAGPHPRLLESGAGLAEILELWSRRAVRADLDAALELAIRLDPYGEPVVLSDAVPQADLAGRARWRALGRAADNLGILAVHRRARRLDVELIGLTRVELQAEIILRGEGFAERRLELEIGPDERRRLSFELPMQASLEMLVEAPGDGLPIDDRILLPGHHQRPLGVALSLSETRLEHAFERAMQATGGMVELSLAEAELVIADHPAPADEARAWLEVLGGTGPVGAGPFRLAEHPLVDGLPRTGLVWAASDAAAGRPLLRLGDHSLLGLRSLEPARLELSIDPKRGLAFNHPAWPVLVDNLGRWVVARRPGWPARSLGAGRAIELRLVEGAELIDPQGARRRLEAAEHRIEAPGVGTWTLERIEGSEGLEVLPTEMAESDLRDRSSLELAGPPLRQVGRDRSLAAFPLLLALICLAVHQWWVPELHS